jgi:D-glycero-alpha-D-manno-heptose-7-phosphate kinase
MILSRTPFRVTLGGGGTDLPSYYEKNEGFIFSMGINKYMYVALNISKLDKLIRLHYTKSEEVFSVSELKHDLAREALKYHNFERSVEISSLADIPAGTGVGSSSCYLIGLLRVLREYKGEFISAQDIAEEACDIELNILNKGIGKQDQYMAAFGGLTTMNIDRNGIVKVGSVEMLERDKFELTSNTHLYYTGFRRGAENILSEQDAAMKGKSDSETRINVEESLNKIKRIGYSILDAVRDLDFDNFGLMLDEHWQYKKNMSSKVSISKVDNVYETVKKNYSVLGGKIIGAGGGGFLMLYCNGDHRKLESYMKDEGFNRLYYGIADGGSKIITSLS